MLATFFGLIITSNSKYSLYKKMNRTFRDVIKRNLKIEWLGISLSMIGIMGLSMVQLPSVASDPSIAPRHRLKKALGDRNFWVAKFNNKGVKLWVRQLSSGSQLSLQAVEVTADSNNNILVTGHGNFDGDTRGSSVWVAKYSADGNLLWRRQVPGLTSSYLDGVATDSSNNVFITGSTFKAIDGGVNKGSSDVWVAKYDPNGTLLWARQLGTFRRDYSSDIVIDVRGDVLITGCTSGRLRGSNQGGYDVWVAKYTSNGDRDWLKQFGTSNYECTFKVVTDRKRDIFLYGNTNYYGDRQYRELWVAKLSSNSKLLWMKQLIRFDSLDDFYYFTIDTRRGNFFLSGNIYVDNPFGKPRSNAYVTKYDPDGILLWTQQFGTAKNDEPQGIAVDSFGNVLMAGKTGDGGIGPDNDVWVIKYNPSGSRIWLRGLRTQEFDSSSGITADSDRNVIVIGETDGNLSGD
jgi:hypothetical protein